MKGAVLTLESSLTCKSNSHTHIYIYLPSQSHPLEWLTMGLNYGINSSARMCNKAQWIALKTVFGKTFFCVGELSVKVSGAATCGAKYLHIRRACWIAYVPRLMFSAWKERLQNFGKGKICLEWTVLIFSNICKLLDCKSRHREKKYFATWIVYGSWWRYPLRGAFTF